MNKEQKCIMLTEKFPITQFICNKLHIIFV